MFRQFLGLWSSRVRSALEPFASAKKPVRGRAGRHGAERLRLLFVDVLLPLPWYGAGYSRANAMMRLFVEAGWDVTVCSVSSDQRPALDIIRADIPREVEIVKAMRTAALKRFLVARAFDFDLILVSRRRSLDRSGAALRRMKTKNTECKVIFDFEALPPLGVRSREVLGKGMTLSEAEARVREQIADVDWVEGVICNSEGDAQTLQRLGRGDAAAVNYLVRTEPTAADFSERKHLLFVGRLVEEKTPNVDGFVWFVRDVWPKVVARLGCDVRLQVVGLVGAPSVLAIKDPSVEFLGVVPDLREAYNHARVFVAANRVSFGVPIKVLEAAAYGLPVVTTDEVNSYLGWDKGTEILCDDDAGKLAEACVCVYEDAPLWRTLRDRALARVDAEGSRRRLQDIAARLVSTTGATVERNKNDG